MVHAISEGAIKIVEILGISEKSFDDAVDQAIKKASKTIDNITGLEVVKYSARVEDGKIIQYRANVKLAFPVK